jgi:diguanylate cyclase (GGDEF)-like protein
MLDRRGYKLLSAWGFREADEVLVCMNQESSDKIYFLLGKDGSYRVLYMETDEPVEERERRIYTIFAKRLEEIFSMVEAITERNRLESSLRKMALTDDLTKLYNRRGFFLLGEQYLELSKRLRRNSILLYIDVDNMKWINDNLGHSEGDRALMEVASILRKTSRKSDVLARIGGDEFALLGLETGSNSYNALIERIKEKIEYRNRRRSLPYRLSLSIGVAICDPNNPSSLKALLEEADKNMYEEKRRKKQEIKNQP